MGETIHWELINALQYAAEAFIEKELEKVAFLNERLHFADVEGNDAEHLKRNIDSARRRIDETKAFRASSLDVELGNTELESVMTGRVRGWLRLGAQSIENATRRQMSELGVSPDEIDDTKRQAEYSLSLDDRQRAIFQHFREMDVVKLVLACLQDGVSREDQAACPTAGEPQVRQFIGWRGTPEQLEALAEELQQEKFVADAEAFAAQFKDAKDKVGVPCRWLQTARSLVHLLEKLLSKKVIPGEANIVKEAIGHFLKKDGRKLPDSLKQNRSNAKDSTNSRGFKTIDTIISEVFP